MGVAADLSAPQSGVTLWAPIDRPAEPSSSPVCQKKASWRPSGHPAVQNYGATLAFYRQFSPRSQRLALAAAIIWPDNSPLAANRWTFDSHLLALITILIGLTIALIAVFVAPRAIEARVIFDRAPDAPRAFGYRMAWLAIKTEATDEVIAALELTDTQAANWNCGIGTIYAADLSDTYVFVTPPVKGWTFVVGVPLPHPVGRSFVDKLTPLLGALSSQFKDVQYFAAFPVIDFFAWARLERGKLTRAFAIGDDGVIWDRGRLTREEKALGLKLFDLRGIKGRSGDAGGAIILHPTEPQVLTLARAWSLDPATLDAVDGGPATGFIARAPSHWRAERIRRAAA